MNPTEFLRISLLFVSVALLVTAQQNEQQEGQKPGSKEDIEKGKRYREQEPPFRPPPLPIQRKLQVFSGAEHPPSFFTEKNEQAESRQFTIHPLGQQQPIVLSQPIQADANPNQFQQRQQFDVGQQLQQFNQVQQQPQTQVQSQPPVQQPNAQFGQDQSQQNNFQTFNDQNNFQSRQQENLPTLPPVFIPPNNPVGPPPQLQSPIRNLFREPEPSFSLAGLLQRFLRLFNLGNN